MLLNSLLLRACATKCRICIGLLITVTLFFELQPAIAQQIDSTTVVDSSKASFQIGISGGLSFNSFHGQPQTGQNTGYTFGLSLHHKLYKNLAIQVEANFLQQGGQLISFKDDTRIGMPESFFTKHVKNSSVRLNGIEIPAIIKYRISVKQTWVPAIYAGASYVYNLKAGNHYQKTGYLLPGEDIIATVQDYENVSSQYNKSRLAVIVGASLQMPLYDNIHLCLDVRYSGGLSAARSNYSYMEKVGFGTDIKSNSFISKLGLIMPLSNLL